MSKVKITALVKRNGMDIWAAGRDDRGQIWIGSCDPRDVERLIEEQGHAGWRDKATDLEAYSTHADGILSVLAGRL